jgi:hypothetical protein
MARISTRLEPVERDIALVLEDVTSGEAASAILAQAAAQARDEAIKQNMQATGSRPEVTTYVDGRKGAPLASVKPDGTILFEFDVLTDLFLWIANQLIKHSPVLTGRYRASHQFYADGLAVDPAGDVPDAEEYVFLNLQPYARKIERGLSPQAPDGVYQVLAKMARARFGNVARIAFGYRAPMHGAIHEWASITRMPSRRSPQGRAEWLRRQPAIIIRFRTERF